MPKEVDAQTLKSIRREIEVARNNFLKSNPEAFGWGMNRLKRAMDKINRQIKRMEK